MTKAAVAVMVKGIAVDLAGRGITVNNIQPGPTVTDMTVDHIEAVKPLIPLKRAADPDEIAALRSGRVSGIFFGCGVLLWIRHCPSPKWPASHWMKSKSGVAASPPEPLPR